MRNILRTRRPTKFKLSTRTEHEDPRQLQAPWTPRSKVKVVMSRDASDRCWPISRERNILATPKLVGNLSIRQAIIRNNISDFFSYPRFYEGLKKIIIIIKHLHHWRRDCRNTECSSLHLDLFVWAMLLYYLSTICSHDIMYNVHRTMLSSGDFSIHFDNRAV